MSTEIRITGAFGNTASAAFRPHARTSATDSVAASRLSAERYKFTHTLFVCVYFSSASFPWSRPKPDSLKPPNGSAGS